jgi:hypothetical protein
MSAALPTILHAIPFERELANHAARIETLESRADRLDQGQLRLEDKLDSLRNWMMGTLAAALLGVAMQLIKVLTMR